MLRLCLVRNFAKGTIPKGIRVARTSPLSNETARELLK